VDVFPVLSAGSLVDGAPAVYLVLYRRRQERKRTS
jgi:hypothetical protein